MKDQETILEELSYSYEGCTWRHQISWSNDDYFAFIKSKLIFFDKIFLDFHNKSKKKSKYRADTTIDNIQRWQLQKNGNSSLENVYLVFQRIRSHVDLGFMELNSLTDPVQAGFGITCILKTFPCDELRVISEPKLSKSLLEQFQVELRPAAIMNRCDEFSSMDFAMIDRYKWMGNPNTQSFQLALRYLEKMRESINRTV